MKNTKRSTVYLPQCNRTNLFVAQSREKAEAVIAAHKSARGCTHEHTITTL